MSVRRSDGVDSLVGVVEGFGRLDKIFEESGVDAFVGFVVSTSNSLVVELDNMMVQECSFQ
eukprot:14141346-Ditylum_brightwellii.AAC.1